MYCIVIILWFNYVLWDFPVLLNTLIKHYLPFNQHDAICRYVYFIIDWSPGTYYIIQRDMSLTWKQSVWKLHHHIEHLKTYIWRKKCSPKVLSKLWILHVFIIAYEVRRVWPCSALSTWEPPSTISRLFPDISRMLLCEIIDPKNFQVLHHFEGSIYVAPSQGKLHCKKVPVRSS